ncbi:hypothetical protein OSB04_005735 [Centaurea solstitialis]|uniref:Uncharacterized protein n=1 Tax=Centaurea solstitialis TaxID=347529 RepID=A0AA38TT99_9ASTR|nr:hypothetical protein OSB04_005735 [Centaurea solstitialis]
MVWIVDDWELEEVGDDRGFGGEETGRRRGLCTGQDGAGRVGKQEIRSDFGGKKQPRMWLYGVRVTGPGVCGFRSRPADEEMMAAIMPIARYVVSFKGGWYGIRLIHSDFDFTLLASALIIITHRSPVLENLHKINDAFKAFNELKEIKLAVCR